MRLIEIILEGFKSHGKRTVLTDLDACFTAISGPNGSGKSNVLDAICFNLGITDLSKVRAENLNALIYKSGQAGVTKATVTLIWDNTDAGQSPHGYESHAQITVTRQIVLGGRSKYMINGTTAQLQRVMNLYHSVQLNVNNPHFLIMQGRIAKVINMKPVEVLGMIEEAAGTRMFQNKKENAQKTIQKKEVKVAEIDRVISQDIKPKLEKHKSERVQFVEYANKTAEVEEHTRFMQAHQLHCLRAKEAEMEEAVSTEKAAREAAEAAKAAAKAELAACEKEEKEVKAKRAKAQGAGGEFKKLEEAEKKAAEALVKEETAFTEAQKSHKADEARVKALEKAEAAAVGRNALAAVN
jgi:structural maintenance of chromosome 2